jgi:hypothetical protein
VKRFNGFLWVVCVLVLAPCACLADSQGPLAPGTLVDDASVGTKVWSNPTSASGSDDVYATTSNLSDASSHYLKVTNLGFSIATGSTITGIQVAIERSAIQNVFNHKVDDQTIKLVKGGTIQGSNEAATSTNWGTTDSVATYGSSSDLWALTWGPSDINDATFGVVVQTTMSTQAKVDAITVTVSYTPPPVPDLPAWGILVLLPVCFYWLYRQGLFSFELVGLP